MFIFFDLFFKIMLNMLSKVKVNIWSIIVFLLKIKIIYCGKDIFVCEKGEL